MQVSQAEATASPGSRDSGSPATGTAPDPDRNRQASEDRIIRAYRAAESLQIAHLGELDNTRSFERLKQFGTDAFQSPRDVDAFNDLMQRQPGQFSDLRTWYADAAKKSTWARDRMLDDPFERTPELPAPPQDYTAIASGGRQGAAADSETLARFNDATKRITDNEAMYHAASQNGPIKQAYLAQHTPPKPLWRQQVEDGIGRFVVGTIPGVNLFTNQIVPARSLSPAWRQGIDAMSGIAGGFMGGAAAGAGGRLTGALGSEVGDPMGLNGSEALDGLASKLGKLRKTKPEVGSTLQQVRTTTVETAPSKPVTVTRARHASQSDASSIAGAEGSHANTPPHAPASFAASPDGRPVGTLHPDADHRGIWRDSAGKTFIDRNGTFQQAGYDALNRTWWARAKQSEPVRLDRHGIWQAHGDVGLKGGMPNGTPAYTDELGRQIYTRLLRRDFYDQIASDLHLTGTTTLQYAHEFSTRHHLSNALQGYDSRYAELFYHRHEQGQSYSAIARAFFTTPQAARRHVMTFAADRRLPVHIATSRRDLPAEAEAQIRMRIARGEPNAQIAGAFNVSPRRIARRAQRYAAAAQETPSASAAVAGPSGVSRMPVEGGARASSSAAGMAELAIPSAHVHPPSPASSPGYPTSPVSSTASAHSPASSPPHSRSATDAASTSGWQASRHSSPSPPNWNHADLRLYLTGHGRRLDHAVFASIHDWYNHAYEFAPAALNDWLQIWNHGLWNAGQLRAYVTGAARFPYDVEDSMRYFLGH